MYYDTNPSITDGTKLNTDSTLKMVQDVKVIGCGAYHAMIVVMGDIVYSCGLNNYGQLGLGDTQLRYYYNEVELLSNKHLISLQGNVFIQY